jgi:iron transport multicopper oxidase
MTIIAVDGVSVRPQQADQIVLTAAQRYDVLIRAKRNPTRNYAFVARFVDDMFDSVPPTLNMHMDGVLQYSPNYAPPPPIRLDSNQLKPYDDFNLVPLDGMPLLKNPDQTIELAVNFSTFSVGQR